MDIKTKSATILMAEDDPDDRLLISDAFKEVRFSDNLRFVEDGEELLDYLRQKNKYHSLETAPRPGLILLDLNMPKKDGRQALLEIKSDPNFQQIPVVVLSTSNAREDILECYAIGASSYISKPALFEDLVGIVRNLANYWLEMVELPL
jgi:two-component system response regulator